MNKSSLPYGVNPIKTAGTTTTTTQGTYKSSEVVFLNDIILPKFVNGRHVQGVASHLFDSPTCPYDVILGRDFLKAIGLRMDFENECIQWLDTIIEMKNVRFYDGIRLTKQKRSNEFQQQYYSEKMRHRFDAFDNYWVVDDEDECFSDAILERKYSCVPTRAVADRQKHLTPHQQDQLNNVLKKYTVLFDGKLGRYPHKQFHLELVDNFNPVYKKAYPVPYQKEALFKNELDNLVHSDGKLQKLG